MRKIENYRKALIESLKDPKEARAYLAAALEAYEEDHNEAALLLAVRSLAEAQGGLSVLAERTHLNRQNLYKVLSGKATPRLDTMGTILNGLGYRLSVEPLAN